MARDAAQRDRNLRAATNRLLLACRDLLQYVAIKHKHGFTQRLARGDKLAVRIKTKPAQLAAKFRRFGTQQCVVGVENEYTRVLHSATDNPLYVQQLIKTLRTEIAKMIFRDIGDQRRVRAIDAESTA